jgi:SARP family transcriptional regulator, regulator of embCAB operon
MRDGREGVEFGVLGPLQISVDGAPVSLGTPKQRAVLAAKLLINRDRLRSGSMR